MTSSAIQKPNQSCNAITEAYLAEIFALLKAKGFKRQAASIQSAMKTIIYSRPGNPQELFEINFWHGTGKGARNFGESKIILSVFYTYRHSNPEVATFYRTTIPAYQNVWDVQLEHPSYELGEINRGCSRVSTEFIARYAIWYKELKRLIDSI